MNFQEWASFDVRSVPTDILKSIYFDMHHELSKRREIEKVARGNVSKSHKVKNAPDIKGAYNKHKLKSLNELMDQNWSSLYFGGCVERRYYVYAHIKPSKTKVIHKGNIDISMNGVPFYVGKGTSGRAWDLTRNEGHGKELKQLKEQGFKPEDIVYIIKDCMTEAEAFELEAKLIYFFGTKFQLDRNGLLVNLNIPITPYMI